MTPGKLGVIFISYLKAAVEKSLLFKSYLA